VSRGWLARKWFPVTAYRLSPVIDLGEIPQSAYLDIDDRTLERPQPLVSPIRLATLRPSQRREPSIPFQATMTPLPRTAADKAAEVPIAHGTPPPVS
jgi:hypothetical protein